MCMLCGCMFVYEYNYVCVASFSLFHNNKAWTQSGGQTTSSCCCPLAAPSAPKTHIPFSPPPRCCNSPSTLRPAPPARVLGRLRGTAESKLGGPGREAGAGGVRVVLLDLLDVQSAAQAWMPKIFSDLEVLKMGYLASGVQLIFFC